MTFVGKAVVLILYAMIPAMAQPVVGARAGLIQFAQGDVSVDAQPVRVDGKNFPPINDGQVLRTGRGRVEVLLAPSVFLRLGSQSSLRMVNSSLEFTQVELRRGTATIEVVELLKVGRIQIEQGKTTTEFKGRGLYRFESDRHELKVFGGDAEVRTGEEAVSAGRGRTVQLGDSLSLSKFNPGRVDALHQWAASRSFQLFTSSYEEVTRRTDWEITVAGWFWNRNFDMKFFSPVAAAQYRGKEARDAREKAAFEQVLKSH